MSKHNGQLLEYSIRKKGFNLSELAKALKVNRRTLYNWFQAPNLKSDSIYRVGIIMRHDFSVDFPELFDSSLFNFQEKPQKEQEILTDDMLKDKYINLLEKYNSLLIKTNKENTEN